MRTSTKIIMFLWCPVFLLSLLACSNLDQDEHDHPSGLEEHDDDAYAESDVTYGPDHLYCGDMVSCADAKRHLDDIAGDPHDWDSDDDGIPCENTACDAVQCDVKRSCDDLDTCIDAYNHMSESCSGRDQEDWHRLDPDKDAIPCEEDLCEYQCQTELNCDDFSDFDDAQKQLRYCDDRSSIDGWDFHDIDGDDDGLACESERWGADCGGTLGSPEPSDYSCQDMSSCSQAKAFYYDCEGDPYGLDSDADGTPCNSQGGVCDGSTT